MNPLWRVHVLTLFPEMFPGPLGFSLVGKALHNGLWTLGTTQIRDFACPTASGIHQSVDDTPCGGGAGMVMRPDVLGRAVDHVLEAARVQGEPPPRMVYLTPRGQPFTQAVARTMVSWPSVMVLCGRYEGVDERILEAFPWHLVSAGDYVVSGGEMALWPLLDACVRLLPGVTGNAASVDDESFSDGLLEYPHYTRPAEWQGRSVPDILLSGHHARIQAWRQQQAAELTRTLRPDLWKQHLEKSVQKG